MDHESRAILVHQVYDSNHPPTQSATDNQPFFTISLAWKTATRVPHDRLNLRNRATVFRRMFLIPFNPAELRRYHDITI
jgi:hypothetical protein